MKVNWLFCIVATAGCMSQMPALAQLTSLEFHSSHAAVDSDLRKRAAELGARIREPEKSTLEQTISPEMLFAISDTIEALALQGDFSLAQNLCQLKLAAAEQRFGKRSAPALDALQDGIFLAAQQRDREHFKHLLLEYSSVTAAMRKENLVSEIDSAERQRKQRLQAKMKAAMSTILQPL